LPGGVSPPPQVDLPNANWALGLTPTASRLYRAEKNINNNNLNRNPSPDNLDTY